MKEKKQINIEVGRRIKKAREEAGYTQEKFSEIIQLGEKNISAIERGSVGISLTTMKKICESLSISADSLLFESTHENNVDALSSQLKRLHPKQFAIVHSMLKKVFEAFTFTNKD